MLLRSSFLTTSALHTHARAAASHLLRPQHRNHLHTSAHLSHVHGPSCSHSHVATPSTTAIPPPTSTIPTAAPTTSSSSSASLVSGRPLPPVLKPGELPPGDNPHLPGWYQRPLPPVLVPFSSNRGKAIFKEAMNKGGMEGYFALAEQFATQSTPSYCGPGTLAMVLNALALDPKRVWKGSWRWFSEEMLETCDTRKPEHEPLAGVETNGLSFEEFLFLAECNGSNVRAFRSNESSIGKFRAAIATATTRTDLHLVASFSRKVLGQTGSGHYSPIGGYHAGLDLALVLDVARFKYPPYWAPVSLLWDAVRAVDEATGQPRGYYLMSKGKLAAQVPSAGKKMNDEQAIFTPLSSACRIAVDKESWSRLAEHFCSVLPKQLEQLYEEGKFDASKTISSADQITSSTRRTSSSVSPLDQQVSSIFREILLSLPVELSSIFMMYTHDLNERMIAQYQRRERTTSGNAEEVTASASGVVVDENACTTSSSCQVHISPLSIYHTLLPKQTPHHHSHSVHTVHALAPLLNSITRTRLFTILQLAEIDFAALESKQEKHLLAGSLEGEMELATLLLFACPEQIFSHLPDTIRRHIINIRSLSSLPSSLQLEVRNLRSQMGILAEFCMCGAAPSIIGNENPNIDPADVRENEETRRKRELASHIAEELHATHEVMMQQAAFQQQAAKDDHQHQQTSNRGTLRGVSSSSSPHRFVSRARSAPVRRKVV